MAAQVQIPLNRKVYIAYVDQIIRFIRDNSLRSIKELLQPLPLDQCTRILNTTIFGCTPLFMAVALGKSKISHYLIKLSLRQGPQVMSESWKKHRHPLIGAMQTSKPALMKLILRYMHINEPFYGPFTPLMLAILNNSIQYVNLMVSLGADANLPAFDGSTPLILAVINENICQYFVAMNVNLNQQDENGYTALHFAVNRPNIKCIRLLVHAGADVRIRTREGLTPLMWAAINQNLVAVTFLWPHTAYSELERIEALEVISAFQFCTEQPYLSYCIRALQMRKNKFPKNTVYPPQDILDFSLECTTTTDLEKMRENALHLAFQGILIIERIFGRNNVLYLRFLFEAALIAKKRNHLDKLRQLIEYIPNYYQPESINFFTLCWRSLVILYKELAEDVDPENLFHNGAFDVFKMMAEAVTKQWMCHKKHLLYSPYIKNNQYCELVDVFLYEMSRIKIFSLSNQYQKQFFAVVIRLVKEDPRLEVNQSLLHRAIKSSWVPTLDAVLLVRVLLVSGADVNAKDYFRRTPLMYAIKHTPDNIIQDIISLLLKYNCHLDCFTNEGLKAMNFRRLINLSIIPNSPRSLRCLATEAILDNQIAYEEVLLETLKDFVNLHK